MVHQHRTHLRQQWRRRVNMNLLELNDLEVTIGSTVTVRDLRQRWPETEKVARLVIV